MNQNSKWWLMLSPDANDGGDSSTTPDANGTDSSTVQDTDAKENDQQVEEKVEEAETSEQAEQSEESSTEETTEQKTEEEGKETKSEEQEEAKPVIDKVGDEKLDFSSHPRFAELVTEKNRYKDELASVKPQAERMAALDSFVTQNGITGPELQNALQYLQLKRSDPAKAFALIKQDYELLAQYNGEVLPPDLQAEVAAGTLSPERAKQIVQAEARQRHQEFVQRTQGMNQQQQQVAVVQGAINAWDSAKRAVDPDFHPKAAGQPDGIYELVDVKLAHARVKNPPQTAAQAQAQVEQVYTEVKQLFAGFRRAPVTKKPLRQSTGSPANSSAVVKTAEDVMRAIQAGKKPHQMKYT